MGIIDSHGYKAIDALIARITSPMFTQHFYPYVHLITLIAWGYSL